jgi:hypothetical protein
MTFRAGIVYCFALACFALTAPSVCRGQGRAAQPASTSAPAAKQADVEAAVALLCKPADIIRSQNGNSSGCKSCPEGTDFFGQNMGEWELRNSLSGHFTSGHDDELLVGGFNCDSHANNFGGSFLFSLKSGKPQLLRYDNGLLTDQCHKFPFVDGREFLVCRGGWSGQGLNDSSVFMAQFDATGKDTDALIFTTSDATATCVGDSTTVVPESRIKDVKFVSKEPGHMTGMAIIATHGDVTCAEAQVKPAPGKNTPSVKTYEIQYLFDGKKFAVAPRSESTLRVFAQK